MALPTNDKMIGDLGHTEDHNAIVNEIVFIKENYFSASSTNIFLPEYLRADTASSIYATITSPSFTGTPLAPTAASGTNTTQIATTQFVRNEVTSLVDSAPETLDTLKELAAALGDDPNFATTVTESLSLKLDSATASSVYLRQDVASDTYLPISASSTLSPIGYLTEESASAIYLSKIEASETYLPISASATLSPEGYLTASAAAAIYAPINSPSFTGIPIGPTASAGNNTNQLATTQFVSEAILAVQTGSSVDLSAYLRLDTASSVYLTQANASATYLPISASANFGGGTASVDLSDYLTIAVASATYLPISASSQFAGVALAVMSPTEPPDPLNGTIWVDTDSEMLPYSSSAVDLSIYLTKESASALYLSSTDAVIDCGGP